MVLYNKLEELNWLNVKQFWKTNVKCSVSMNAELYNTESNLWNQRMNDWITKSIEYNNIKWNKKE